MINANTGTATKVNVTRCAWWARNRGWKFKGSSRGYEEPRCDDMIIYHSKSTRIGVWQYDDMVNGILPNSLLSPNTSDEEILPRVILRTVIEFTFTNYIMDAQDLCV
jgi:hypothetical protein